MNKSHVYIDKVRLNYIFKLKIIFIWEEKTVYCNSNVSSSILPYNLTTSSISFSSS
jgi:hypothetical protein